MSEDLLKTLEDKVQNAVEMVEFLKVENAELTEENESLKEDRAQWDVKVANLIGKFEQLEEVIGQESPESNEDSEEDEDSPEPSNSGDHNFSA